jgi:hypothetical protein
LEDGPPSFPRGSTCPAVLRVSLRRIRVSHTGLSPSAGDLSRSFCYPFASHLGTLQPPAHSSRVWAVPRSLAATYGISIDFFSSGYGDVSVPRVRLRPQGRMTSYYRGRVSPFGDLRIKTYLAAPRRFSQLIASFIASWRQGIHHTPSVA